MSEEAAAAIDADGMKGRSGGPESQGSAATNGYHDLNGRANQELGGDGVSEVDAAQVTQQVLPAAGTLNPASSHCGRMVSGFLSCCAC